MDHFNPGIRSNSSRAERALIERSGLLLKGDPKGVPYAIENVRRLLGEQLLFGICLEHQILGLAMGGKTYKLKFGHHGSNQPVMDLSTEKVEITAQNHDFAVDIDSLGDQVRLTYSTSMTAPSRGWSTGSFPSSPSNTIPRLPRDPMMPATSSVASPR